MPQAKQNGQGDAAQARHASGQGSGEDMVSQAIYAAKTLEAERARILARVDANRKLLRLLDDNDALTEEQGEWLDTFYPAKAKDSQRTREEVAATRKLREAGVKEVTEEAEPVAS